MIISDTCNAYTLFCHCQHKSLYEFEKMINTVVLLRGQVHRNNQHHYAFIVLEHSNPAPEQRP